MKAKSNCANGMQKYRLYASVAADRTKQYIAAYQAGRFMSVFLTAAHGQGSDSTIIHTKWESTAK
jgi:hypothetical protein